MKRNFMKTSDRLLLGFFLLVLVIYGAVQFTLYTKYRRGEFVTGRQLSAEQFRTWHTPRPRNLVISHFQWVRIIPSDTFYFGVGVNGKPVSGQPFQWLGDTLSIAGEDMMGKSRPDAMTGKSGYWMLIVYCPPIDYIRIKDAEVKLTGPFDPSGQDFQFDLDHTTLSLGTGDYPDTVSRRQYFHGVRIDARAGRINLEEDAHIDSLSMKLDAGCNVYDNGAVLNSVDISGSPKATIHITRGNLDHFH